jgi:hypothetical protein
VTRIRLTGLSQAEVLAALDEAAAAGLVAGGDGWPLGHDLIRETARLELPTADRLAVHARMADYLRRQPDAGPAAVAHHLLESLPVGDAALAADWAERAADAAMGQLAWEDAAAFYTRALRAAPGPEPADRAPTHLPFPLHCGLGLAQLRGFELTAGSSTLREAAEAARAAGDPALIGEVALAMEGYTDPDWVTFGQQLCGEALAGDRLEAGAMAVSAAFGAERLGMLPLLRDARGLVSALDGGPAGPLTRREDEIAGLVGRGLTNRQIAAWTAARER